jgi:hypothetical protein
MITLAGSMDYVFVNVLGMPFGTGIIIYGIIIVIDSCIWNLVFKNQE